MRMFGKINCNIPFMLILIAILISATGVIAATDWVNVGSPGFSAGVVHYTSLALDGSGTPYVAYLDWGNVHKASVMKFDGTNWVNVGSPGFSAGWAPYTSLALDGSGIPYVAYRDDGNAGKATLLAYLSYPTMVNGNYAVPANESTLSSGPTQITIEFDMDVKSDGSGAAANNPANYLLVEAAANGFQTTSCGPVPGAGGVKPDDVQITVDSVSYDGADPYIATLNVNSGVPLPDGTYRLFICGTTSIENLAGVKLNGGQSDSVLNFIVSVPAIAESDPDVLPATGFPRGSVTRLAAQPQNKSYSTIQMMLEIPKLGLEMPIVGVPRSINGWDVTWLGDNAGYLAGSAFPTWAGNTVITGHVWDAYDQPGPFADLKSLQYGDHIKIPAMGQTHTYEVREQELVWPNRVDTVLQHKEQDWVTLMTCEFYNPLNGEYLFRRAVEAVLMAIR